MISSGGMSNSLKQGEIISRNFLCANYDLASRLSLTINSRDLRGLALPKRKRVL